MGDAYQGGQSLGRSSIIDKLRMTLMEDELSCAAVSVGRDSTATARRRLSRGAMVAETRDSFDFDNELVSGWWCRVAA